MVRALAGLMMAVMVGVLAAACGGASEPAAPPEQSAASSTPTAAAPAADPPEPVSLVEVFPEGPGRDLALNTCGACHAVACSAIGQRTAERWTSLKEGHRDRLQNTAPADIDAIFGYLAANFNDAKPEPKVPPRFLEGGCTPF